MHDILNHHSTTTSYALLKRLLATICLSSFLIGCSEVQFLSEAGKSIKSISNPSPKSQDFNGLTMIEEGEYYKIGKPYQIKGIWYYPKEDYQYSEEGIASWYGPNFHGKLTANGTVYDQNQITAAHRTLPLPSLVRVTNLENGRSLVVKVNDRGPFARNRIIDLSHRSAEVLGVIAKGTALVRVEILAAESMELAELLTGKKRNLSDGNTLLATATKNTPEAAPLLEITTEDQMASPATSSINTSSIIAPIKTENITSQPIESLESTVKVNPLLDGSYQIFIQAGAFSVYQNALNAKTIIERSIKPVSIEQYNRSSTPLFRVRVGPITSSATADQMLEIIQSLGYNDARIISPSGQSG